MSTQYIVIVERVVGDERGFEIVADWDGLRFNSTKDAIAHGFKVVDSDDFAMGRLYDGALAEMMWMGKHRGDPPEDVAEIASKIGLKWAGCKGGAK